MRGREPRGSSLPLVEPPSDSEDLETPERGAVGPDRDQKRVGGAGTSSRSADGVGQVVQRSRLRRKHVQREGRPRQLGRERLGTGRNRAYGQAAVVVGDADRRDVGAGHLADRVGDVLESLVEPVFARSAQARGCERLEGVVGDVVHSPSKSIPHGVRRPAGAFMLSCMAQPARRPEQVDEALELDPAAVQRAYQLHRARRRAHRNKRRETKRAKLRFWLVLFALVAASVYLSIVIWHQVQRTFGL